MSVLTIRQRNILELLLDAGGPQPTTGLARQLNLTPRQVNYDLKGLKQWLAQRDITLSTTPGVGVEIICSPIQNQTIREQLHESTALQLVLDPHQRQQLLALLLVDAGEPFILHQLEQLLAVSRTTVLSDLDEIEPWLAGHNLELVRRPNYGIEVQGVEQRRRQALAALAWGRSPFAPSLLNVSHSRGVDFSLAKDQALLPIVQEAATTIERWQVHRLFGQVAYAETQLGGRYSDDAVLYLALIFAIQTERVDRGHTIADAWTEQEWLKSHPVWQVAEAIASHLRWGVGQPWPPTEVAFITRYLLAAPRNERWPGDLDVDSSFETLIDHMMAHTGHSYQLPALEHDKMLRDGIVVHMIPAYLRQRFGLWMPTTSPTEALSTDYVFEHQVAAELGELFAEQFGTQPPQSEIETIALLLRAAYIRERPYRLRQVYVICPSGMASAQLLVARLRARFPRLGEPVVLSVRQLTPEHVEKADLVLTTIPLQPELQQCDNVLQIHQLLLPEDVETLTEWLASR